MSHFVNISVFKIFILLSLWLYLKTSSSLFPSSKETFLDLTLLLYPHPALSLSPSTTRRLESDLMSITAHESHPQLHFEFCPHHSMKLFGPSHGRWHSLETIPPSPTSSYPVSFYTIMGSNLPCVIPEIQHIYSIKHINISFNISFHIKMLCQAHCFILPF